MRKARWLLLFACTLPGLGGCPTGGGDDIVTPPPVVNATVTPDSFLVFDNTLTINGQSQIDSVQYAEAYYAAVDPFGERTTLAAWKATNGFDSDLDAQALFRDSKDLGYGREMYARQGPDGSVAVYVNNYLVEPIPGDATNYGPINLEAAIARDANFHIGTSALEYTPINPADPSSDKIVKMFVYGPPDTTGGQQRLLFENLDGRGAKFMPTACFVCHGGNMYPLNPDGSFPEQTLKSAKMNILDPATFEFTNLSEAEQQGGIRQINRMVHDVYQDMGTRDIDEQGRWDNVFAMEIAAGPYGGDFSADTFDETFVPAGWQQDGNRPDGVATLYKEVVEPHCVACHSLRGSSAATDADVETVFFNGQNLNLANAVTFSTYEEFISYNDEIIERVYRRARMPLSLLNYSRFWNNPAGPPAFLATFLTGFDVFDGAGRIADPGAPVPVPGADRTVRSPVRQKASGSLLTDEFLWNIVSQPVNATANLAFPTSNVPELTADTDGEYVLALTATNALGSETRNVTVTIDSMLSPGQRELRFDTDIRAVFNDTSSGRACRSCHAAGSEFEGIAVFLDDSNPTLYSNVLERVNLVDPENSVLLRKPSSLQHGGGLRLDRSVDQLDKNYITILNWIRIGAPCGSDPLFCN